MIGTLINTVAILAGTALGLLLRKGIPERMRETVMQGLALCVVLIGVSGAIKTGDTMCVIVSMVVGGLLGSAVNIEHRLDQRRAARRRVCLIVPERRVVRHQHLWRLSLSNPQEAC